MKDVRSPRLHRRVVSAAFIGALLTLLVILCFYTIRQIQREREGRLADLELKGKTLIHSLEAGARVGMVGMLGGRQHLQTLLEEAARDPEVVVIEVINEEGTILGSTQQVEVGSQAKDPQLGEIFRNGSVMITRQGGVFQLLAPFYPSTIDAGSAHRIQRMMGQIVEGQAREGLLPMNLAIRVGLSTARLETALREEMGKAFITALICFSGGAAALYFTLLAQDYRSVRRALQEMQTYTTHVLESMADGLVSVDVQGRITTVNPMACQLLRCTPAELEGREFTEVFSQTLVGLDPMPFHPFSPEEREIECVLPDGQAIPLAVSITPLTGTHGKTLGAVVLLRDLRTLKALQQRVERTERLAALGRLAAGVAHEIRNPLGAIRGLAQYFLATWKDNPEQRAYLDVIVREVDRLNRVVGDLVEFAVPREPRRQPHDLIEIVQHAVTLVQADIRAKGVQIVFDLGATPRPLSVDRDLVLQALLNVLLNAIEAMESDGVLSIRLAASPAWMDLRIEDTGRGIESEHLGHIFDPFFSTKQKGMGLGLAIAYSAIQAHDGEIIVDSIPAKGTVVTIRLPNVTTAA